ncbi:MAG: hypothetical protein SVS85_01185 [Candidatus Nanohaloarchaea archaeon]|nr:hypothetical protein [Candidatus Nanohaloarchaea archaeon]
MGGLALTVILSVSIVSSLQYSGASAAFEQITWILGLGILGLVAGLAGRSLV